MLSRYYPVLSTPAPDSGIDVAHLLEALADQFPRASEATLDQLCRKISVARGLSRYYHSDWTNGTERLEQAHWNLLVALLCCHAREGLTSSDDRVRGRALKHLDAALKALDLREGPTDIVHELLDHLP